MGQRSKSQILLLLLSIEKVVQHLFVTFAFAVDLGDIGSSVAIDPEVLMIIGFIVALLFGLSAWLQLKEERWGYRLLLYLAAFDFVSEFVAQGTLAIEIVLSIIVATVILIVLFRDRKTLLA